MMIPVGSGEGAWRVRVGCGIAAVGVLAWSLMADVVGPAASDVYRGWANRTSYRLPRLGLDEMASFDALFRDLRWAAMLLAFGGLLLVARERGRQRALAAGAGAWIVGDLVMDAQGVRGWPAAGLAAAIVTGTFLVLLRPRPAEVSTAPGSLALVYSGAAIGAALPIFLNGDASVVDLMPGWVLPVGLALTVLLLLSGVIVALAVAPSVNRARLAGAGAIALLGVVPVVLSYPSVRAWKYDIAGIPLIMVPLVAGGVAFACAFLGGALTGAAKPRLAVLRATIVWLIVVGPAAWAAIVGQLLVQFSMSDLADHYHGEALPALPAGLFIGGLLGLAALLAAVPRRSRGAVGASTPVTAS